MSKQVTVDQIEAVRCSIDEAETTFIIERNSDIVKVWSSDNTYITKLKRCMKQNPDEFKCFEGSRDQDNFMTGYFFEFPKLQKRDGFFLDRGQDCPPSFYILYISDTMTFFHCKDEEN